MENNSKKTIKFDKNEKLIYINKNKLIKAKKVCKIGEKLVNKLNKKEINKLVINKKLKENKELINKIISSNIKIFDGRWLIEYMLPELIEYVLKYKNESIDTKSIAILVNDITDSTIQNIKLFASKCKTLTIVTKNTEKIKKIEEKIYNNEGIMIVIANNKKKTLVKKDIIINFDFCEEEINKYNINNEADIINVEGDIKIYKKRFNGLNINDYEINILNKEKVYNKYLDNENVLISESKKLKEYLINQKIYNDKEVYEALIFRKDTFNNIRENIIKDNVEINGIIGVNSKLF